MKCLKSFAHLNSADLKDLAQDILQGAVSILPTDTVIGLAAAPSSQQAVDRLYKMKDRPRDKNLPIMVADAEQISKLGAIVTDAAQAFLASAYMPGPLTLVLALANNSIPDWLEGRHEIAVRIPNHTGLRAVLKQTGPLLVTSANLSGQLPLKTSALAAKQLTALPDICISGEAQSDLPSTLIDCTGPTVRIIRQGAITKPELANIWSAL